MGLVVERDKMSKIQETESFFETRYGYAKFLAIVLAITYIVVGFIYSANSETIWAAMMFIGMASMFLLMQAFDAVAKHCLCDLGSMRSAVFAISLIGIVAAFYARDFAFGLALVWPVLFAIPASYIITTYFTIWTKAKGNITS